MHNHRFHMLAIAIVLVVAILSALALIFANGYPLLVVKGRGFYVVPAWVQFVFFFVLIAAIYLAVQRDTYLPFLGTCVLPPTMLKDNATPERANTQAIVDIPWAADGTKVVYWAANPASEVILKPSIAYRGFENSGITTTKDGKATLKLECPANYEVGYGKELNKHVHYRIVKNNGMLGRVYTKWVDCK